MSKQGNLTVEGAFKSGAITFPTVDGTVGQVLVTDGAGNISWDDQAGGGGTLDQVTTAGNITTNSIIIGGLEMDCTGSAAVNKFEMVGDTMSFSIELGELDGSGTAYFDGNIFLGGSFFTSEYGLSLWDGSVQRYSAVEHGWTSGTTRISCADTGSITIGIGGEVGSATLVSIKINNDETITFNEAYTFPAVDGAVGQVLTTDGAGVVTWEDGGGGAPAGSDKQVQFNDGGAFGAAAGFVYDASGGGEKFGVGVAAPQGVFHGATTANTIVSLDTFSTSQAQYPRLYFRHSLNDTKATYTTTTSGTALGLIEFRGVNNVSIPLAGAKIYVEQDGAAGSYIPSDMRLSTFTSSAENTNQLVLNSDGTITFSAFTFPKADGTANQVLKTNGSGTVSWGAPTLDLVTGAGNTTENNISVGNITIGVGAVGVDYTITFDGYENNGIITWLATEDQFQMACKLEVTNDLMIGGTTNNTAPLYVMVGGAGRQGFLEAAENHAIYQLAHSSRTTLTIEMFVKVNVAGTAGSLLRVGDYPNPGAGVDSCGIYLETDGTVAYINSFGANTGYAGDVSGGDWHHVMVRRQGTVHGVYIDGVQVSYDGTSSNNDGTAQRLTLGFDKTTDISINEFRIYNGDPYGTTPDVGLTGTYVVPVAPHTSDGNTICLLHLTSDIVDSSSYAYTMVNSGGLFVSGGVFGTGEYLLGEVSSRIYINGLLEASGAIHLGTTTTTNQGTLRWNGSNVELYNATPFWEVISTGALISEPTGFPNRTDTTLSFNNGTHEFTITGTNFKIYIKGKEYIKNTELITINPIATGNLYFIYYDSTGTLTQSSSAWNLIDTVPIATVYWNGATGLIGEERHGVSMPGIVHEYLHSTVGVRYSSGLAGTFGNATFSVADGSVYDEDIKHTLGAAKTTARVLYRNGVNGFTFTTAQTAYYTASTGVLDYDNAGTRAAVVANSYVAYWIFVSNDSTTPIYSLMGQRVDTTIANARANNTYESLLLGTLPFSEMKLIYRVIVRNVGGVATWIENQDMRSISNLPAGTYVATAHGALTGLNVDDHLQYARLSGRVGSQILIGGTDVDETLTLQGTSSGGNTATNANLVFNVGNAGATVAMTILNNGKVGIGEPNPDEVLEVNGAVHIGTTSNTNDGTIRYTGTDFEGRKSGAWASLTTAGTITGGFPLVIDNGGETILTGIRGDIPIPFACTLTGVTLLADQSGSIVLDLWKDSYANYEPTVADTITASAKPTITSAIKSQDTTLTGWTTSVSAGDIIRVNVDSVTSITRLTMLLTYTRTL